MLKNLFEQLKELNLPKGKYAVFGSGPLCIRGFREPNDLDVIVEEELFEDLKNDPRFKVKKFKEDGGEYLSSGKIDVMQNWRPDTWDIGKIISEAETINDLPFVKLGEVLKWKKMRMKEKDIRDIKAIEEYLDK